MGSALSLPRNMEKAVLMMAKKVLIVEDDSNIAELLNLYLEKEGFEPLVAKDGGTINAITGATITSRAVTDGVNTAAAYVATLG